MNITFIDHKEKDKRPVCIVRLVTSSLRTKRGITQIKSINILKKQSKGYDFFSEDINAIGVEEVFRNIINLYVVADGVYRLITVNEKRDWETGLVDDYEYKLISF